MPFTPLDALGSTYEGINRGVHRRTASIVGVPSVVRHVGFWAVGDKASPRPRAFNAYLASLKAILEREAGRTIHVDKRDKDLLEAQPETEVRSGTIRIARFWWHGMRATIRAEFRTEYVMITSILDLSVRPCAEYEVPDDRRNPQRRVKEKLDRLKALFDAGPPPKPQPERGCDPSAAKAAAEAAPVAPPKEYFEIARFLQYDLWKLFEKQVLDAKRGGGTILGTNFGHVFADFRGVVTGSSAVEEPPGEPDPTKRILVQTWRPHFKLAPYPERTRQLEHGSPPADWARDTLSRLWPLIEPHPYLHEYEFTVSGFLAGRALFVTALGPKLPSDIKCGWDWTPVCNFIHSYTDDVWQLGRLVDRIKNLGTLRLAATVEIERLIDAGGKVDALTDAIRKADQAIQGEINRRTGPQAPPEAAKPAKAPAGLAGRQGKTAAAAASDDAAGAKSAPDNSSGVLLPPDKAMAAVREQYRKINADVSDDILYRLERGEYYIEQFTKGTGALRVERIEGFQKYDEMVTRRMSGVFSYIRLMRNRMVDVDARMSALSRAYASLKAVETTKDIQDLVNTMNGLVSSMETQDEQIKKIQESGEIALIGFLIPYYVGTTFIHYAFHLEGAPATRPWLWTITIFAGIVLLRSLYRMYRERSVLNTGGLTFLISLLYILAVWLLLPSLLSGSGPMPADAGQARAHAPSNATDINPSANPMAPKETAAPPPHPAAPPPNERPPPRA
jgi:hypothetical protein